MRASRMPLRWTTLVGLLLFCGLALAARDRIPLWGAGRLAHRVLGHPPLMIVLLLGGPLAIGWVRRGLWGRAAAVAAAGALVLCVYAFTRIEARFPNHRLLSPSAYAQAGRVLLGKDLLVSEYRPRPALVVPRRSVARARYPVIDVHFHLGNLEGISPARLVTAFDSVGVAAVVNLDGTPDRFEQLAARFKARDPDRYILFAMPDFGRIRDPDFVASQLAWFERAARMGARGLKVWKSLGLMLRDREGRLVPVDDPRLDPLWERAADLGFPVLIHVGDPRPFFEPVDRSNERFVELVRHPEWSFYGPRFPPLDSIWAQRERLVARHPRAVFIAAHMGDQLDDLREAARMLDAYPNYYLEISSRLSELGRQPRTAREFLIRYQDRVLFGTDGGFGLGRGRWTPEEMYRRHFELLETENEYVDYPLADLTRQGDWKVYGLGLPDSVLRKLYYANAARLLAGDPALQRALAEVGSLDRVRGGCVPGGARCLASADGMVRGGERSALPSRRAAGGHRAEP